MKKVRLNETDLIRIIKNVINEDLEMMDVSSDSDYYKSREREVSIPRSDLSMLGHFATRYCEGKPNLPDCQKIRTIYSEYGLFM